MSAPTIPARRNGTRADSVRLAGGKGAGLRRLRDAGLEVPEFVIVDADAYRASCPGGAVPAALPPEAAATVRRAWESLGAGRVPLAVRSSAVEEDGARRSFAGQMETRLNVRTLPELEGAVLACWRSLHSERAGAYRAATGGLHGPEPAMAVVVQRLIDADASGVVFTVNPISGRPDEMLVNAAWGLGEGIVSGALDADTFVTDRGGRILSADVAAKPERIAPRAGGGTTRAPVPERATGRAALDADDLVRLATACRRIEAAFGAPQDVEFAFAGGRLWILQSRPVTAAASAASGTPGTAPSGATRRWVWDNSNIVESYPGVTLPLTFSFLRRAYHAVYSQFCELLGVGPGELRRHETMLRNMLGRIHGRVYYNLLHWYRLVSLLPGYRFNRRFMEGMMGVRQPLDVDRPPACWKRRYFKELPRLVRTAVRVAWLHLTLPLRIRRFHRDFDAAYRSASAVDPTRLTPREAWAAFLDLEERILWRWKAPIVNDFEAMVFYGLLEKLTVAWDVDREGSVQNTLLARQGDLESARVSDELVALAGRIAEDEAFADAFANAAPEDAARLLAAHERLGPVFAEYLCRYGDRTVEELKLESVPLREDPSLSVAALRNHLRAGAGAGGGSPRAEADLAERIAAAEKRLAVRLAGRRVAGVVPRAAVYRWVLKRARRAVRDRENQRLARTRAFGLVRGLFRSIGAGLARAGTIAAAEDVFYLTIEEIEGAVAGSWPADLRETVARRRAATTEHRRRPPLPDRFETIGLPDEEGFRILPVAEPREGAGNDGGAGTLRGRGACPGIVERRAIVLEAPDPSLALDGEILVAHHTDPGWVVLFPSIGGLVVERGSMLSHSAIVAREMGIPAVVGVRGACAAVRSGDRVRLDGAAGTVTVVARDDGEART